MTSIKYMKLLRVIVAVVAGNQSVTFAMSIDDIEIAHKMQGTCEQRDQYGSNIRLTRTYTYSGDGSFTEHGERIDGTRANRYVLVGTWRIRDRLVHYEILSSTHPGVPVGYKNVNRVTQIDAKSVVMDTPQGRSVRNSSPGREVVKSTVRLAQCSDR